MTARSIRRAAERKRNKLARKLTNNQVGQHPIMPEDQSEMPEMSTGQFTTDPDNVHHKAAISSEPGTQRSQSKTALDTVTSPLTGTSVLLPAAEAELYKQHLRGYEKEYSPTGAEERALVQSLADISWRLNRIPRLEMAIYALGHTEFANQFDEYEESRRPILIEVRTFLVYEKQLRNLQTQEARLVRRREKETAELHRLQKARIQKEKLDLEIAAKLYLAAQHDNQPFDPAENGFEFSIADIEGYIQGMRASEIACQAVGKHF